MKEETIKWHTGDDFPELDSTILIEFGSLSDTNFNSMTLYAAGYFLAPEQVLKEDDLYYYLSMYDGEFIKFENKKEFTSMVKRWCYLE